VDAQTDQSYRIEELSSITFPIKENRNLIFIYCANDLSSLRAFFSSWKSNAVIALLARELHAEFKISLENTYKPDIVFDTSRDQINGYRKLEFYFQNEENFDREIHAKLKLLLNTSGTTGSPKFVKLSEENLYQNAQSILNYLPINHTDVAPMNLPFHYSFGLSVLTTNAIGGGKIIFNLDDILKREFWQSAEKYAFSSYSGVPYVYDIFKRTGFFKKEHKGLRYLIQAGGKLQENLVREFAEYAQQNNVLFYVMYGQTEATARMSYLPPDKILEKSGSVGIAIQNGEFMVDPMTAELAYSGPNVFGGYSENPGDLKTFNSPNWLFTGDLARMDADGFVYITGRSKRMIKITGNRMNLDEVESLLSAAFGNAVFAATGEADKKLVVAHNHLGIANTDISEYLRNHLGVHPAFVKSIYLEQFPLTANGKPDYRKILELAGN